MPGQCTVAHNNALRATEATHPGAGFAVVAYNKYLNRGIPTESHVHHGRHALREFMFDPYHLFSADADSWRHDSDDVRNSHATFSLIFVLTMPPSLSV